MPPLRYSCALRCRIGDQEFVRVLNKPELKERLFNLGVEAINSSPAEFAAFIKAEMAKMGKVIKDAGIRTE